MDTVTTVAAVREHVRRWRSEGRRVAFVPTMGNLHAGHMSLIEAARRHGDRFVASIFVNPMQFGPNEDYAHYPRTPHEGRAHAGRGGCNLMFMPDVAEIYPNGSERATRVDVPSLSRILDGEFRPGHFEGVSTIVATLFHIVRARRRGVWRKGFPTAHDHPAHGGGSVHARGGCWRADGARSDGLAMSSRNQYLTPAERQTAPRIYQTLQAAANRLQAGDTEFASIERTGVEALDESRHEARLFLRSSRAGSGRAGS